MFEQRFVVSAANKVVRCNLACNLCRSHFGGSTAWLDRNDSPTIHDPIAKTIIVIWSSVSGSLSFKTTTAIDATEAQNRRDFISELKISFTICIPGGNGKRIYPPAIMHVLTSLASCYLAACFHLL
jgi:hypothetical protein